MGIRTKASACLVAAALLLPAQQGQQPPITVTIDQVKAAEQLYDLQFTPSQEEMMLESLSRQKVTYERLHKISIANNVPPAVLFNPIPVGFVIEQDKKGKKHKLELSKVKARVPANQDELAWYSVRELGELLRTKKITSEQLTRLALARVKKYDPQLHCVITITEDLAIQQARQADDEIRHGRYRGPLHGIPYGAKDLLATKGIRTTWGAKGLEDQMFDEDATVIQRLRDAGAVLVAKMTMGELAQGDVWFGERTRSPWNLEQGSSGSSAGSAAAVAAGLLPFAIGTETLGSIVSPSTRCGTTGLRPTYGRVSRSGAMALSWSMDKIGPICRNVEDCAAVFDAIRGPDGKDQTLYDAAFHYDPKMPLSKVRIGYLKDDFGKAGAFNEQNTAALDQLRKLGANLVPVELPKYPVNDMRFVLSVEAAAAFDEMTRTHKADLLKQQEKGAWPNTFRTSQFVPAVEYIQASRLRTQMIQDMQKLMANLDVYVAPTFGGNNLVLTNLSGHPCVVVPTGFGKDGMPTTITFMGQLFGEAKALEVAKAYQDSTEWNKKHPKGF